MGNTKLSINMNLSPGGVTGILCLPVSICNANLEKYFLSDRYNIIFNTKVGFKFISS
jgi:hypothetical protein